MAPPADSQGTLFELPGPQLQSAAPRAEHLRLAEQLPPAIRLGAMTWTYPGWAGIVYGADVAEKRLASHGLTAYAKHPLLRTVELDRTYYQPLSVAELKAFAAQVPDGFRFVVKAHGDCTIRRFPNHARHGSRAGTLNPRFLDPSYAERSVVAPLAQGLGAKLGCVLFQLSPEDLGPPPVFADKLHGFLRRLPGGIRYAVELRNPELLTPGYGAALEDTAAIHCHNAWPAMPPVLAQARRLPRATRRPLLVRWLMRPGDSFQDARARYAPFDRIVSEDPVNRRAIADFVAKAHRYDVPAFVLVDNKAEGCAPESVVRLAQAVVETLSTSPRRAEE